VQVAGGKRFENIMFKNKLFQEPVLWSQRPSSKVPSGSQSQAIKYVLYLKLFFISIQNYKNRLTFANLRMVQRKFRILKIS